MDQLFHKLLISTQTAHYKLAVGRFAALALSPGQPKILESLRHLNGCMQKDLAQACDVEPATITSLLPDMEKKGLITRKRFTSPLGKRGYQVSLTEFGMAMEKEVAEVFSEIEAICFADFNEEEKKVFLKLLERINQNIC